MMLRADLLDEMKALDANAPTAEELAAGGITQLRYLNFLDASTSTAKLGFRIDGARTIVSDDGDIGPLPLPEGRSLETLREEADVAAAISTFVQHDVALAKAALLKLESIATALERSNVFPRYVLLRSHLLWTYDDDHRDTKMELKMINFGASYQAPDGATVSHTKAWDGKADSHEDGYMHGVQSLIALLKRVVAELEAKTV